MKRRAAGEDPGGAGKSGLPLVCAAAALAALGVLLSQVLDHRLPGDGVAVPEYVVQDLLPVNEWSRPGTALEKIDAVVIHYVGNPDTTAQANRNYFASLSSGEEGSMPAATSSWGWRARCSSAFP